MLYRAKSKPGQVKSGEWRRLIFLAMVVILGLSYLSARLQRWEEKESEPKAERPLRSRDPDVALGERARLLLQGGESPERVVERMDRERGELSQDDAVTGDAGNPFEEDPSILAAVEDWKVDVIEQEAFYYLLQQVQEVELSEQRQRADSDSVRWQEMKEAPATCRGRFVQVKGRVIKSWQQLTEQFPNRSGLPWVWMYVVADGRKGYMVAVAEKIREVRAGPNGDAVQLTGVFFKGHAYLTESEERGTRPRGLPLLVARQLDPLHMPNYLESYPVEMAWIAVSAIVLAALVLGVALWRSRQSSQEFEQRQLERRKQKFLQRQAASAGDVAEPTAAGQAVAPAEDVESPAAEPPAPSTHDAQEGNSP